jgi:hypothetical protein
MALAQEPHLPSVTAPLPARPSTGPPLPVEPPRPESACVPATAAALSPKAPLRIVRTSEPLKLEDFLNGNPVSATRVTGFRQRSPGDGTPASEDTSTYLAYDDKNLYAVFVCKQDPSHIRAYMSKREDIDLDDNVSIYLDTFQDGRRAYLFVTNPLGIQRDGFMTEGQGTDFNFDALWYSQGKLTRDGFVVWIAIPFRSLRFRDTPSQTWGIALGRSIVHTGEEAYWPYITNRVEGMVRQFAPLEGLEDVSRSHSIELIPYGTLTRSRFLNSAVPGYSVTNRGRAGLDGKIVLGNTALDLTLNPDFSEVESDDPQVVVNQRFEVFFPEKRPFFLEHADFFRTSENLFYSRRIADPEFGGRLSGKLGGWALGALVADDRRPGRQLAPTDTAFGARAVTGVLRVQREIGKESTVGVFGSSRTFESSFNQVISFDTRLKVSPTWVFTGQISRSFDRELNGTRLGGPAYLASLDRIGRHFMYTSSYLDRSPTFSAPLGFIDRVDIRQVSQFAAYYWYPENNNRFVVSYGPSLNATADWNRKGDLRDWSGSGDFSVLFRRASNLKISHAEYYELFQLQHLREHGTTVSLYTSPARWLGLSASYGQGAGANYQPSVGLTPFVANVRNISFGFTLRPVPRLRFDETYLYSGLSTRAGSPEAIGEAGGILNNQLSRSKLNFQFSKALSLRAILDYNGVLPNRSLIAQERTKRLAPDVLLTYLLHPGTAFYVGYHDQYDNLEIQPSSPPRLIPTASPEMSTGRQLFFKLSYAFRP